MGPRRFIWNRGEFQGSLISISEKTFDLKLTSGEMKKIPITKIVAIRNENAFDKGIHSRRETSSGRCCRVGGGIHPRPKRRHAGFITG